MFLKKRNMEIIYEDYIYNKPFGDKLILLAGNPNVGKSTVFNALTGLKQHTGNWTGKTVMSALGTYFYKGKKYVIADIPGCYSLKARSQEEKCAGDAISFGNADAVVVICNAFALERNMNLVLQICEASDNVMVCINMADEAKKRGIEIDCNSLEKSLGVPVRKINARKKKGLDKILFLMGEVERTKPIKVTYGKKIESAIHMVEKVIPENVCKADRRYMSVRLLEGDETIENELVSILENTAGNASLIISGRNAALEYLSDNGISSNDLMEKIPLTIEKASKKICSKAISGSDNIVNSTERIADKLLTGPISGFIIMLILLGIIFYITLVGANSISDYLSKALSYLEPPLCFALKKIRIPSFAVDMIVFGGYRVLSWVISVMLPPMAIFFPLFTFLEDVGYLPRIAFNLDRVFKKCKSCGKQALTTCMGFGCNAAAVSGARIIDSPRERMIAIVTNSFIPCNGRFPALICLITIFFPLTIFGAFASTIYLLCFVVFAVILSLITSLFLSKTFLKGTPSSFALELPSFRKPQIGQIIIRSLLNRTLFVLARAVSVAFPAGVLLWILCNTKINDNYLVHYIVSFLDPLGRLMGMDGAILTGFILGIPANEIVLPIVLMIYSCGGVLSPLTSYASVFEIFSSNGWTITTALCTIIFFIMHWPCSTTLLTIKKETGSIYWTVLSFALPTLLGVLFCIVINIAVTLF